MKTWLQKIWNENKILIILLILMVCFRSALADWNTVPTGSMNPTIVEGDRILVNKLAYDIRVPFTPISLKQLSNPERGDIVTIESESAGLTLVKRVIGVPGDTVEMIHNIVVINGKPAQYRVVDDKGDQLIAEEDLDGIKHLIQLDGTPNAFNSFPAVKVPENMYLVLGDNRNNSADSRVHGFVPRSEIRGRSQLVMMSLNYDNYYIPRSDRFFKEMN